MLQAGSGQTLSATFFPTDSTDYNTATPTVQINVNPSLPPASPAQIVVTKTLARNGSNQVVVSLNITNAGGTDAPNVQLTIGKIGTTLGTTLPQSLGTVAKGTTVPADVDFRLVGGLVGRGGRIDGGRHLYRRLVQQREPYHASIISNSKRGIHEPAIHRLSSLGDLVNDPHARFLDRQLHLGNTDRFAG